MGNSILTHGNYIHFNDRVSKYSIVKLIEEIENVNIEIAQIKQKLHTDIDIPIFLFINSWGGCLDSALVHVISLKIIRTPSSQLLMDNLQVLVQCYLSSVIDD